MKRIIDILNKTQFGALSTIKGNQPQSRPFQFQYEDNEKLYFCTSADKEVFKQLSENPFAEYSAFDKALNYARVSGEVVFCKKISKKEKILKMNPFYKEVFGSAENKNMVVFYIEHGIAMLGHFSTYPPEIIIF